MTTRAQGPGPRAEQRRSGALLGGPRMRLGLAIGSSRLTAIELPRTPLPSGRPRRSWAWPLTPPAADGSWPSLAEAVAELRAELGAVHVTVGVALLRPFGHTKAIVVPPLRSRELGVLVTRNVRRYFAIGSDAVLADARFLPRRRRAGGGEAASRDALAVAAHERDVEMISTALSSVGFRVVAITTGSVAIAEGVRSLLPAAGRGRVTLAVSSPDMAETIELVDGRPVLVQPAPAARQLTETATVVVTRAVGTEGVQTPISTAALRDLDPSVLAASGAARLADDVPLLLPADVKHARQVSVRRRTYQLAAAAALTGVLAAGFHLWGLRRELEAVATERRAIAPAVGRATASRRAAVSVLSQLETIARLERTAPRYTEALTALAEALPDSAYLVSFAAQGTTFRVGGVARATTSMVVPALAASPHFADVALFSPIERDDESGAEQFDLTLSLRARSGAGRAR